MRVTLTIETREANLTIEGDNLYEIDGAMRTLDPLSPIRAFIERHLGE